MSDEEQAPPLLSSPPFQSAPLEPERDPFWGYSDLFLFFGMAIPCMLLGFGVVKAAMFVLHLHAALRAAELLAIQFAGYGFLFAALAALLRIQYDRPFWRSLGWTDAQMPGKLAIFGAATSIGILLVGSLIHTPTTENPMTELLKDRTSMILMTLFGVTAAPLCEELIFRGFLQPLLVRSLGAFLGIVATALPFGLLHLEEYGYSWRHVLLISLAGMAFGWARHTTGSTKASTIMHAAYNAVIFFLAILARLAGGGRT